MRNLKLIITAVIIAFVFTSCNDDDKVIVKPVEAKTMKNLYAPQNSDYTVSPPVISGTFTKFSFKEGKVVTGDNWDIAFRGLKVIVNGGSKYNTKDNDEPTRTGNASITIVKNTFDKVTVAPNESEFNQDAERVYGLNKGGDSWYTYNGQTHVVTANAGTIIVVKTAEGNYAKMEIVSYYKDAPDSPTSTSEARYYTFNYVYNTVVGDKNLQ